MEVRDAVFVLMGGLILAACAGPAARLWKRLRGNVCGYSACPTD